MRIPSDSAKHLNMTITERKEKVKQWKVCNNCLSLQHSTRNCTSHCTCSVEASTTPCYMTHVIVRATIPTPLFQIPQFELLWTLIPGTRSLGKRSVLLTLKVQVVGKGGTVTARSFVDTGSAISCVTSRLATSIKAKMKQLTLYSSLETE